MQTHRLPYGDAMGRKDSYIFETYNRRNIIAEYGRRRPVLSTWRWTKNCPDDPPLLACATPVTFTEPIVKGNEHMAAGFIVSLDANLVYTAIMKPCMIDDRAFHDFKDHNGEELDIKWLKTVMFNRGWRWLSNPNLMPPEKGLQ